MSVTIKKVTTKDDLRKFIQFGIDLYEGNDYYVPPLIYDEMATLNMSKNPALNIVMPRTSSRSRRGRSKVGSGSSLTTRPTRYGNRKTPGLASWISLTTRR